MNKEIKDILLKLQILKNTKEIDEYHIDKEDGVRLLNYITNLQKQLEISQTNEETYRLEMLDITKCLGLDEHTMFDEVKEKATNLQEENNNLKEDFKRHIDRINELTKRSDNLQEENEDLKDYLDIFKLSNKTKQETIDDFRKRVDKAIEYIKVNRNVDDYGEFVIDDDKGILLNILNGGDE